VFPSMTGNYDKEIAEALFFVKKYKQLIPQRQKQSLFLKFKIKLKAILIKFRNRICELLKC